MDKDLSVLGITTSNSIWKAETETFVPLEMVNVVEDADANAEMAAAEMAMRHAFLARMINNARLITLQCSRAAMFHITLSTHPHLITTCH